MLTGRQFFRRRGTGGGRGRVSCSFHPHQLVRHHRSHEKNHINPKAKSRTKSHSILLRLSAISPDCCCIGDPIWTPLMQWKRLPSTIPFRESWITLCASQAQSAIGCRGPCQSVETDFEPEPLILDSSRYRQIGVFCDVLQKRGPAYLALLITS